MSEETSPKNNTKHTPSRYTPEEEKELDEMAQEFVDALNSQS